MDMVTVPKRVLDLLAQVQKYGTIARASELQEVYRLIAAHSAGSQGPVAWHSIPDTPPVELMEWYGDQFSVPVLLHDEEKILPFVARWSFPEDGWVGAQFSDGPSPDDYEHLNEKHMRWMLLSDVTDCAHPQPMPQTDAEPEHSAIYIAKKLTGSTRDAVFVQAHINQAVSEAMERYVAEHPQPVTIGGSHESAGTTPVGIATAYTMTDAARDAALRLHVRRLLDFINNEGPAAKE